MRNNICLRLALVLLVVQIVSCRTVTHYKTTNYPNGDTYTSTWTSTNSEDPPSNENNADSAHTMISSGLLFATDPEKAATNPKPPSILSQLPSTMDPDAVAELLKTQQPVVRTTTDENGAERTTTYSLDPDGTISRKTIVKSKPRFMMLPPGAVNYNHPKKPTVTDANEEDVKAPKVNTPLATNSKPNSNPTLDWEWAPPAKSSPNVPPTRTYTDPDFGFNSPPWHSEPGSFFGTPLGNRPTWDEFVETRTPPREHTTVKLPESWDPTTWSHNFNPVTNTGSLKPTENIPVHVPKANTTPTSLFDTDLKDPFESIDTNTPGTVTKTFTDDNGRTVTTTYTVGPTRTNVFKYPTQTWHDVETTTKKLPSLDDFLKSQYDTTTLRSTGRVTSTTVASPKATQKPKSNSAEVHRPTTTIKLEDIPVTQILKDGKPVDEDFLKTLPTALKPVIINQTMPTRTYKVENIPVNEVLSGNPNVETNVKTLSKTVHTNGSAPKATDLDPNMQEILKSAGISPDDINSINGDTITKTRVEPDGKIVTTTFKMRTIPHTMNTAPFEHTDLHRPIIPHFNFPNVDNTAFNPDFQPHFSNPIDEFLAKIGLSASNILSSKNGEFKKTIVDNNGRILTATFLLSTPRDASTENMKAMPTKVTKPIK